MILPHTADLDRMVNEAFDRLDGFQQMEAAFQANVLHLFSELDRRMQKRFGSSSEIDRSAFANHLSDGLSDALHSLRQRLTNEADALATRLNVRDIMSDQRDYNDGVL